MAKLRWLPLLAVLWLVHCGALAAPAMRPVAVRSWETDDGLPNNSIIAMVQTRDGYLWLGTLNGLVRFDGLGFRVFNTANTPGLPENRIVCLFEDSQRRLWIGTENGGTVFLLIGRIVAPPELAGAGQERRLGAAPEDAGGSVWLLKANGDVWRYQGERAVPFAPPSSGVAHSLIRDQDGQLSVGMLQQQYAIGAVADPGSLQLPVLGEPRSFNRLECLAPSPRGGYWRMGDAQVHRVTNGVERMVTPYRWPREVSAACEDADGNLIVGTRGAGVFVVTTHGLVTPLASLAGKEGLTHPWVESLVVDRDGTLWVGTDGGGLNRVKPQTFRTEEQIPAWPVDSVTQDAAGRLVLGTSRDGLAFWEGAAPLQFLGAGSSIPSVLAARDGSIWFSTFRPFRPELCRIRRGQPEVVERNLGGGLIQHRVQAIHEDRAGRMWFGTAGGLVGLDGGAWKRFTTREGLTGNQITAIADDADGRLWIGTERSGLNRFEGGAFTALRQSDGAPGDEIVGLLVDEAGTLWVATAGNGLGRLRDGRWTRVTMRDGLASNHLGAMIEDGEGNLWIASNAGVLRVPKGPLNDFAAGRRAFIPCRAFDKSDGLPTRGRPLRSQPGAWRGRDGLLWFATSKGVAVTDPAQLRLNTNPPPVTVESISVDDVPRAQELREGGPAVVMHPREERIEVIYSSLNLGAAERARFRYRLAGYEKDWTDAGSLRVAHYSKLAPGSYTFQVMAANEDGVWNATGAALAIVVVPPFWRTWWFLAGTALVIFWLVAGLVHYFSTQKLQRQLALMQQQEVLEKERARIARDIHDQVGASLTQVALLGELVESDKDLPQEVEAHAQQICQTARDTTRALDEIVWTVNPANDTLEGLVNYICKHAQDFLAVAGLRYRLEVPEVPAVNITPEVRHNVFLASKEAVTNIVRHAKGTAAWVRLRFQPGSFVVEIEDNGRGIPDPDAPSVRNGLKNMRKRLEDVGGRCEFLPGAEGGTLVRFTVPLAKAKGATK